MSSPSSSPRSLKTGTALASMVLGIIGFFTLGLFFVGSIAGLLLGAGALRKSRKNPSEYGGGGLAVAGMILNVVALLGGVVFLAMTAGGDSGRVTANQAAAREMLRNINSAQAEYKAGMGKGNYAANLALLGGTPPDGLGYLDSTVTNAQTVPKTGYVLGEMKVTPATGTQPAKYSITASPAVKSWLTRTGSTCLYTDETGVIRHSGSPTVPATAQSPVLGDE